MRALKIIAAICLAVMTALAAWCAIPLHKILVNADASSASAAESVALFDKALKGTHANGDDGLLVLARLTMQNTVAAVNAIKQTSQDANRIAKAQEKKTSDLAGQSIALVTAGKDSLVKFGKTIDALSDTVAELHTLAANTDGQLNGPNGTLVALTGDLAKTGKALDELTGADGVIQQSAAAVKVAADALADPHIAETTAHMDAMSANLNTASAELSETFGYIRDSFKPHKVPFWQMILSKGVGAIPEGLIDYFLHRTPQEVTVVGK